jgi:hypothetical protein
VLTTATALERLRASLAEAGFKEDVPDLRVLFATWRAWAARPVEGMDPGNDDDMLLFECSLDLKPTDKYSRGPLQRHGARRRRAELCRARRLPRHHPHG